MNARLQQALAEEYSGIFKNQGGDIRQTCMGWGIECGDGWFLILWELCAKLEPLGVVAAQVKEKWGSLRFYVDVYEGSSEDWDAANLFVNAAEHRSMETCEDCGRPGRQVSPRHWIRTLCEKCQPVGDREQWGSVDWKVEAAELMRQRDIKQCQIERLKKWKKDVCRQLRIKCRTRGGAVMEITKLQGKRKNKDDIFKVAAAIARLGKSPRTITTGDIPELAKKSGLSEHKVHMALVRAWWLERKNKGHAHHVEGGRGPRPGEACTFEGCTYQPTETNDD